MTSLLPTRALPVALAFFVVLASVSSVVAQAPPPPDTPTEGDAASDEAERSGTDAEPATEPTLQEQHIAAIRGALDAVGGFDEVRVDEQAGVVRLRGSVRAPAARRIAEEIATRVASPIYVANGIEVLESDTDEPEDESLANDDSDQALAGQLRTILATVEELADVEVQVQAGVVHLRGTTADQDSKDKALEIAGGLEGVLYVDDDVVVVTDLGDQVAGTWHNMVERGKDLLGKLPMLGFALLIFVLALMLAKLIRSSELLGRAFSDHPLLQTVGRRLLAAVVLALGVVVALDVMEATSVVGALMGTAGIVGLALGFAFKDIVENYLAGVLLAVSRPFAPKDHVHVGDFEGKVVRLAGRETILMTLDGNHVQIPNAQIFSNPVLNYTRNPLRRFDFTVGIGNGEDLAKAQRLAASGLTEMKGVMDDPAPFTRLDAFDDSSMSLHVYGWVDQDHYDFGKVKSEAIRQVKRILDENEVDLPNPITQVLVEQVAPKPAKPKAVESAAPAHDLSVDYEIEKQINDDPEAEKDLLEKKPKDERAS